MVSSVDNKEKGINSPGIEEVDLSTLNVERFFVPFRFRPDNPRNTLQDTIEILGVDEIALVGWSEKGKYPEPYCDSAGGRAMEFITAHAEDLKPYVLPIRYIYYYSARGLKVGITRLIREREQLHRLQIGGKAIFKCNVRDTDIQLFPTGILFSCSRYPILEGTLLSPPLLDGVMHSDEDKFPMEAYQRDDVDAFIVRRIAPGEIPFGNLVNLKQFISEHT